MKWQPTLLRFYSELKFLAMFKFCQSLYQNKFYYKNIVVLSVYQRYIRETSSYMDLDFWDGINFLIIWSSISIFFLEIVGHYVCPKLLPALVLICHWCWIFKFKICQLSTIVKTRYLFKLWAIYRAGNCI